MAALLGLDLGPRSISNLNDPDDVDSDTSCGADVSKHVDGN
jgi:hypothetical protein